jgi:hypothetical protein
VILTRSLLAACRISASSRVFSFRRAPSGGEYGVRSDWLATLADNVAPSYVQLTDLLNLVRTRLTRPQAALVAQWESAVDERFPTNCHTNSFITGSCHAQSSIRVCRRRGVGYCLGFFLFYKTLAELSPL